jgi:activating signal cointegrator 1
MKVISLLQPWASLVVYGDKKIETRSWNTKYRGKLLIHASKKYLPEQMKLGEKFNREYGAGLGFTEDLPTGQIIGVVELIHVVESRYCFEDNEFEDKGHKWKLTKAERAFGDYSPDRFGWLLSNPVLFKTGIPAKGSLGLWEYTGTVNLI